MTKILIPQPRQSQSEPREMAGQLRASVASSLFASRAHQPYVWLANNCRLDRQPPIRKTAMASLMVLPNSTCAATRVWWGGSGHYCSPLKWRIVFGTSSCDLRYVPPHPLHHRTSKNNHHHAGEDMLVNNSRLVTKERLWWNTNSDSCRLGALM